MNQRGDIEILMLIVGIIIIFFGGFWLWSAGEESDRNSCKEKYGLEYDLGHSTSNSSIKWCQAPNGEMRAL